MHSSSSLSDSGNLQLGRLRFLDTAAFAATGDSAAATGGLAAATGGLAAAATSRRSMAHASVSQPCVLPSGNDYRVHASNLCHSEHMTAVPYPVQ